MNPKRYAVVIERTSTGFSAYSPDIEGCVATGADEPETMRNFEEALAFHIEGMRLVGEQVPEPSVSVGYVEVAA